MAFLQWSDEYCTGIPEIDADHQVLFRLVNDLHSCLKHDPDHERLIGGTLDMLIEYIDYHFNREEQMLQDAGYSDLLSHARQHLQLSETVHSLKVLFEDDPHELESERILEFLKDWLTGHIMETDMAYVSHLKEARGISA